METTETKTAQDDIVTPLHADLVIPRGFDVSHAKLTLCGNINHLRVHGTNSAMNNAPVNRALIFVIDCSGSMNGSRIGNVRDAVIPFVTQMCESDNTMIKLVKFTHEAKIFDIAKNCDQAQTLLEKELTASGGTDFHVASNKLVSCANDILQQFPTYQVKSGNY